jgi:hypothetical protein
LLTNEKKSRLESKYDYDYDYDDDY